MPFPADVVEVPDHASYDVSLDCFLLDIVVTSAVTPSIRGSMKACKRITDIVISLVVLVFASPVFALIAVIIKCTSPGPVLFRQWRYGLHGKPFVILKFRTMTVCEDGYHITLVSKHDRRITRLGHFLRRFSIDELPQFYNVLKGDMTIVGPRPHAIAMANEYMPHIEKSICRYCVKPGITGLAQLMGTRGEVESLDLVRRMVQYDLQYIKTWSVWLDVTLMLRTIYSVLFDNGDVI